MNPGKVVDAPPMVENLRYGAEFHTAPSPRPSSTSRRRVALRVPSRCATAPASAARSGRGRCVRRTWPHATRWTPRARRANALRNALAGRMFKPDELTSREVYDVLDFCLSCKACKTECPSSVDMAKIKTEFLAHYLRRAWCRRAQRCSPTSTRHRNWPRASRSSPTLRWLLRLGEQRWRRWACIPNASPRHSHLRRSSSGGPSISASAMGTNTARRRAQSR